MVAKQQQQQQSLQQQLQQECSSNSTNYNNTSPNVYATSPTGTGPSGLAGLIKEKASTSVSITTTHFGTLRKKDRVVVADLQDKANREVEYLKMIDDVSPCLNAIHQLMTVKHLSLASVFRERMTRARSTLSCAAIQHLTLLCQYYVAMSDQFNVDKIRANIVMAEQLLTYLNTYSVDCDNCFVGLMPHEDLLFKLAKDFDSINAINPLANDLGQQLSSNISTTREQLLVNIINWSAISDNIQLSKAVRRYASILRGVDKIKRGDIVIVRFPEDRKSFSGHKAAAIASGQSPSVNSVHNINNNAVGNTNNGASSSSGVGGNGTTHRNSFSLARQSSQSNIVTMQEYLDRRAFQPKALFARFNGDRTSHTINVWLNAEETEFLVVGIEDVLLLNKSTIECIREHRNVDKIVQSPLERFYAQIIEESKLHTINYLSESGVDMSFFIGECAAPSLLDLERLRAIESTFKQMWDLADHPTFRALELGMKERIDKFFADTDHRLFFMPKYESIIVDIRGQHHLTLARNKLRQLLCECELLFDKIKLEKRDILNGTIKNQITEWWLKLIETKTNAFLQERGYNFGAIPENYIEQPPNNMKDVIKNLALIKRILDSKLNGNAIDTMDFDSSSANSTPSTRSSTLSNVISEHINSNQSGSSSPMIEPHSLSPRSNGSSPIKDAAAAAPSPSSSTTTVDQSTSNKCASPVLLIKELRQEIQPVINTFIKKSHIVLSEMLGLPLSNVTVQVASERLKDRRQQQQIDEQLASSIDDLLSDLEYLREMIHLEDATTSERSLHIVPISGLVMNTFARIENELKTVVELWNSSSMFVSAMDGADPTGKTPLQGPVKPLNGDQKSELHLAVTEERLEDIKTILADNGSASINFTDVNGWTPLHSAAHSGNADVCMLLLSVPNISVSLKNRDGASILHYMVRHTLTDSRKQVVQTLLDKGLDINTGSRHGETPLHSACFRGVDDVVLFLIQNGANVNAITNGGETALHYAVTAGRASIVSTLLQHGAQAHIRSKRGTPLEIANNFKLHAIATLINAVLQATAGGGGTASSSSDTTTSMKTTTQSLSFNQTNPSAGGTGTNNSRTGGMERGERFKIGGARLGMPSSTSTSANQ
ncbi:hypothetical protein SAMD00019534_121000 [Acytostelium subglobosum LB1]|uniref:hypothetical protein n=1 Tax=Acytostelium subglobosum LB1 TaxID=1410327 RepID=UPI000645114D|nr:hypothetical protein SAMD00019534_121000 [Acytostelium subglobosum LB1]GAM28924.1 hypothetical protein SAMD00019534_121000 [Acytostelium subglobosum LB1]|eukprot:XP_012748109.1 hypothetical protein SAMD00019534_121000 [Acytostelium subglobosum LB1]